MSVHSFQIIEFTVMFDIIQVHVDNINIECNVMASLIVRIMYIIKVSGLKTLFKNGR